MMYCIYELFFLFLQKKANRLATLMKSTSIPEAKKQDLLRFMTPEYMSSEESMSEDEPTSEPNGETDSDDDIPRRKKVLVCRPLPWRSQMLNEAIKMLDRKASRKRAGRSVTMMMERRTGAPSLRLEPQES